MSHHALRRVVVRLLHDPGFVDLLQADPDVALAGVALGSTERGWLLAVPPAAWRTDPERPARLLRGLVEEFPVAAALAPMRLRGFFASEAFHRAVQERGSLAEALGEHLAGERGAEDVARLEAAIARVRRAPRRSAPSGHGHLRLAEHVAVLRVAGAALRRWQAARGGVERAEADGHGGTDVLVLRAEANVTVEEIPEGLAAVLRAAAAGAVPVDVLHAVARLHGAEAGEDDAIVAEVLRDGLLV